MAAIAGLNEILITQVIYILILGLITYKVKKTGRKHGLLYWSTVSINILYGQIFGWLFYTYSSLGPNPNPGKATTWSELALILPGVLVFLATTVFVLTRLFDHRNKLMKSN